MSIIHDALKKVQRGLASSKSDKTPPYQQTETQKNTGYLYATPPAEDSTQVEQLAVAPKKSLQNKIKSLVAFICAMAIIVFSVRYALEQFKKDIPQVKRLATKSFYKLINKKDLPVFKTKAPKDLKPLAQLTVNSPAVPNTPQVPAPLNLKIHGIMANGSSNLVLINDDVYQEGDEVEGAKIVKINLNSITLLNNGKEETIRIGK